MEGGGFKEELDEGRFVSVVEVELELEAWRFEERMEDVDANAGRRE